MCLTLNTKKRYLPNLNSVCGELDDISVVYFSSNVKQALICLCKSRSNPSLEPTSTKQSE